MRISIIFRTFVYELRQGLNPSSNNPLTLQQTKRIDKSMAKMSIYEMRVKAERWADKFDRVILDTDETEGNNLILTLQKGTQLDSNELKWLINNFNNVIVEAETGHLCIWLF